MSDTDMNPEASAASSAIPVNAPAAAVATSSLGGAAPGAVPPGEAAAAAAAPSFYQFFDTSTQNGKVLTSDLSSSSVDVNKLDHREIAERDAWHRTLNNTIRPHYSQIGVSATAPRVTCQEHVLQQRIVPPVLPSGKVSTRSKIDEPRKGRLYPSKIHRWEDFDVGTCQGSTANNLNPVLFNIFYESLGQAWTNKPRKEIYEQSTVLQDLRRALVRSAIISDIVEEDGGIGLMDFNLLKNHIANANGIAQSHEIAVVCESKSTHNLLLPVSTADIVTKYNAAHTAVADEKQDRTTEWSHIGHPLAQLIGYMADNQRRHGVLTSGTRSYFVGIKGQREGSTVQVSDAWFVGEPDYLRAWAYIYSLGSAQDDSWHAPRRWLRTEKKSPTPQKDDGDDGGGGGSRRQHLAGPERGGGRGRGGEFGGDGRGGGRGRGKRRIGSSAVGQPPKKKSKNAVIPAVSLDEISIVSVIGAGRNGAAFKVRWKGREAAMKQFDVGRRSETWFDKEIDAYIKLQDVWGELVPRPLFVSESFTGGVRFLGLQLGRDPKCDDDTSSAPAVLERLEKEFGIKQNDTEGRNFIFVSDKPGSERLVAIDFEDSEILGECTVMEELSTCRSNKSSHSDESDSEECQGP